ncbi:MAG: hypothetical protein K9I84_15745 [Leadbetterella sp.]|jgi:hypothetical protein|nr:hypothetical protein [Leadbetterella sp.]
MKTIDKLNDDILKITLKIQTEYPEISVYLTEMPVTIPNVSSPKINTTSLSEYYESLKILLKDYIENQKLLSI